MTSTPAKPIAQRPRLRDVAAEAGVSLATASRALSGSSRVSPETIAAVRAASARLAYRPNPIARALRAQVTGTIGMVVPEIRNPFFAELVEAVARTLFDSARLDLILADSQGSAPHEERRLQTMADRHVDGILVVPADHKLSFRGIQQVAANVPVVQIDRLVDGFRGDYVGLDNEAGLRMILSHLQDEGCRTVVFVSDAGATSTGSSRLKAFNSSIQRVTSLKAQPPLLGTFSFDFGRTAIRSLINDRRLPEAIVCGSDTIALGAVRELHTLGIDIPAEVRVTGFDDILFADLSDPPITTVRQPIEEIADEAVRLLMARMRGGKHQPRRSEITPTLVVRRSSIST